MRTSRPTLFWVSEQMLLIPRMSGKKSRRHLASKRFTAETRKRSTSERLGTKSGHRPDDQLHIKCKATIYFVAILVYIIFPCLNKFSLRLIFGASEEKFQTVIRFFPGYAWHEKGLQRQKGAGPLVRSQEQRALLVPVINRG